MTLPSIGNPAVGFGGLPAVAGALGIGDSVTGTGTSTTPGAGSTYCQIPAASLPAGVYRVTSVFTISGVVDTSRPDNQRLLKNVTGVIDLPTGSSQNVEIQGVMERVTLDGASPLKQIVLSTATLNSVYTGLITATRIA